MRVLRRKLFNRGGYAHRGTGITSGLTPVRMHEGGEPGHIHEDYDGGATSYIPKDTEELSPMHISGLGGTDIIKSIADYPIYRELFKATLPERKKLSRKELMLEPWMTFFSNLGKPTFKKGFGAISENIREAAAAATPAIGKSLEIKRQFEEAGRQEEAQVSQLALQKAMETTAEGTIKDIPIGLFNQMSRTEQERVLGIEDPAAKAEDQTEFEKSVSDIQGTLGQPKDRYPVLKGYGYISDGDTITQEDIDYIQQRMTNDFAMLKSTEKEGLTLQEEKNLARAKNIMENIETPLMTKIADAAKFSQNRQKVYQPILTSLQTFKPGAFVNARATIGKWVELLGPEQLDGPLRDLLSAWKIGNPIAADILSTMSARLTLANAKGGALPGNLNMKEFEELQKAGLPLWTTTEGAKIIAEIYQREDDINIAANKMLGQISSQQDQGAIDSFTIELPNGETEEFGSYLTALNYIDGFIDSETSSLVSGSTIMDTGSLSDQINGLGRYNKETLNLEGKTIAWGKGVDAKEAFEDNKLDFVGFANPDSPEDSEMGQLIKLNPGWAGQAVYQYNTGELWKEGDFGFDPDLHKVNEMKFVYWSP